MVDRVVAIMVALHSFFLTNLRCDVIEYNVNCSKNLAIPTIRHATSYVGRLLFRGSWSGACHYSSAAHGCYYDCHMQPIYTLHAISSLDRYRNISCYARFTIPIKIEQFPLSYSGRGIICDRSIHAHTHHDQDVSYWRCLFSLPANKNGSSPPRHTPPSSSGHQQILLQSQLWG